MPISSHKVRDILLILVDAIIGVVFGFLVSSQFEDLGMQLIAGLLIFVAAAILTFKIKFTFAEAKWEDLRIQSELAELGFDEQALSKPGSQSLRNLLKCIADYWSTREQLPHYLRSLLDKSLENIQNAMNMISVGKVHFTWQDIRDFASEALSEAKPGDKIYTTSYVSTDQWWLGSSGEVHEYLVRKRDAASRGVEIIQIFISPDQDALKRDKNVIKNLVKKPSKGKAINVYAIPENQLPHREQRDVLLIKKNNPIGFELDLKGRSWVEGFYVYTGEKTKQLEEFFDRLLGRANLVKFDINKHQDFEDFVNEVFP